MSHSKVVPVFVGPANPSLDLTAYGRKSARTLVLLLVIGSELHIPTQGVAFPVAGQEQISTGNTDPAPDGIGGNILP